MHTHIAQLVITYLRSTMVTEALGKRTGLQLVQTFPVIYGIQKFIIVSLVHIKSRLIQPISSHSMSVKPILILSHHLRLDLQKYLSSGFPTKTLHGRIPLCVCACVRASMEYAAPRLIIPIVFYDNLQPCSSSLCDAIRLWTPLTSYVSTKYLPQHPVLEHSQWTFYPKIDTTSSIPIQNKAIIHDV